MEIIGVLDYKHMKLLAQAMYVTLFQIVHFYKSIYSVVPPFHHSILDSWQTKEFVCHSKYDLDIRFHYVHIYH